jgi:hypothetical protein
LRKEKYWRGGEGGVLAAGKKGDIRRKLNMGVVRRKGRWVVLEKKTRGML